MLKKEERTVRKEFVTEVICNACGKSMNPQRDNFVHIEKEWGYFSNKDGIKHEVDICEKCWDSFCDGLKIKP